MNKKKIIFDTILNIIASAIPIAMLQLIILPVIAARLGDTQYGLTITLVSLFTLFSHPFGNVLNNIRLLQNNEYERNNITGDFNVLLAASLAISTIIMVFGTIYYEGVISLVSIVLIIIISGLNLMREYLIVIFRITLNYKAILFNNVLLGVGYSVGLLLFYATEYWQLIYICGSVLSLVYITKNTNLLKEKLVKTTLFRTTTYKSVILFLSSFMKTALTSADKLLLFSLLGPTAVSIYYSSTVLGKIISMGITPISSVMLSYLARMEKVRFKSFIFIVSFAGIVCIVGYFVCVLISKPLLSLLYPAWADESMKLIYVTTATAIFGVMSSVIHPLILRFNNVNWQMVISGTNLVVYILCGLVFYKLYGLIGFCFGLLTASIVKLLMMIIIFMFSYHKGKNASNHGFKPNNGECTILQLEKGYCDKKQQQHHS
jgi:O-antigen/teichoic acid export membrane protein